MWSGGVSKVLLLISNGKHDVESLSFHGKHGWPMCSRAVKARNSLDISKALLCKDALEDCKVGRESLQGHSRRREDREID